MAHALMGENMAFHSFPLIDQSHMETTKVDPGAPQCYSGTELSRGLVFYSGPKDSGHKEN